MRRREFITLMAVLQRRGRSRRARSKRDQHAPDRRADGHRCDRSRQDLPCRFFAAARGIGGGRKVATLAPRCAGGRAGRAQMRTVVAELLAFSPDVFMVFSNLALALLKPMAGTVPIVFVGVGDPVGAGFVTSLARPGGNITGFAGYDGPMGGKWLEVLKETAPHLTRIMAILHPETPVHQAIWHSIKDAAPRLGVEVTRAASTMPPKSRRAISSFAMKENGGIMVPPACHHLGKREPPRSRWNCGIACLRFSPTDGSVNAGGLVSYGLDFGYNFRKTAEYVDRILRGEKPSDLPVQQPTKFKLAFNLNTAEGASASRFRARLLARADEVIE